MNINSVELETVCGITSELPQHEILEVAFWGRSNVGKSSLLNCVWNRKNLARTSSEPGKTQTINYYKAVLSDKDTEPSDLYMVDLPGYGYAKTSRETANKWMGMIRRYLETSQALRVVFLLIDSRHDPTEKDIEQFRLLFGLGFNPLIVATKVDKLKKNEKAKHIAAIRRKLTSEAARIMGSAPASATADATSNDAASTDNNGDDVIDELPVIAFSASTGEGRDEILEYLDYFVKNLEV